MLYCFLLIFWVVVTALLWRQAHRHATKLPRIARWIARGLFAAFFSTVLGYMLIPFTRPFLETEPFFPPSAWATVSYVWFPFVLQLVIGTLVLRWLLRRVARKVRKPQSEPTTVTEHSASSTDRMSRRDALALVASAAGPLATVGFSAVAMRQCGQFRVRRVELALPSLPADLDGVTVAHVTDLHGGNFFDIEAAARLADTVNSLKVDLVAFTGDLIDRGLLTRLPIGMKFLQQLDRRHGFAMIEGNHDLREDTPGFEKAMRDAGMPLLLDEELIVRIPGRSTPVQFLGLTWGPLKLDDDDEIDPADPPIPERNWTPEWATTSVAAVAALRRPGVFPILLGHHPHTIIPAATHNFPLVLAGHTHGGQLMLTDDLGAGPIRFKYWNGEHLVGNSKLVICNGVGSWFPLRINAPAEVLHITLRSTMGSVKA